jgi:hypothetical protein
MRYISAIVASKTSDVMKKDTKLKIIDKIKKDLN